MIFESRNLKIDPPLMNASGILSRPDNFELWKGVGALVTKTVTYEEREGNKGPSVISPRKGIILNSMGSPNPGFKYLSEELEKIKGHNLPPILASIYAKNQEECSEMVAYLDKYVDGFEINLSCPNTEGHILGYDIRAINDILKTARKNTDKFISVKIPYYNGDLKRMEEIVDIIYGYEIDSITSMNSVKAMDIEPYLEIPILGGKTGGLSGDALLYMNLAQIHDLKEINKDLDIIAVGGIYNSKDAKKYFIAGADAIQLGSAVMYKKPETLIREIIRDKPWESKTL